MYDAQHAATYAHVQAAAAAEDAARAAQAQRAATAAVDAALAAALRALALDTTLSATDALDAAYARHGQARVLRRRVLDTYERLLLPAAAEAQLLASAQAAASAALEAALAPAAAQRGGGAPSPSNAFRAAFLAAAARERTRREVAALVRAKLSSAEAQAALRCAGRREAAALSAAGVAPADYAALAAAQAVAARRERAAPGFLAPRAEDAQRALAAAVAAAEGFGLDPLPPGADADDSVAAALDAAVHLTRGDRRTLQACLDFILGHSAAFAPDDLDVFDRALRDTAPGTLAPAPHDGDAHGDTLAGHVAGVPRGEAAAPRAEALRMAREYAAALDAELRAPERRAVCAMLAGVAAEWRAADAAGDAAVAAAAAAPRRSAGQVAAAARDAKMRVLFPTAPWPARVSAAAAAAAAAEEAAQRQRNAALPQHAHAIGRGIPGLSRFGLPLSAEQRGAAAAAAATRPAAVPPPRPAPPPRRPAAAGGSWQSQWPDGWQRNGGDAAAVRSGASAYDTRTPQQWQTRFAAPPPPQPRDGWRPPGWPAAGGVPMHSHEAAQRRVSQRHAAPAWQPPPQSPPQQQQRWQQPPPQQQQQAPLYPRAPVSPTAFTAAARSAAVLRPVSPILAAAAAAAEDAREARMKPAWMRSASGSAAGGAAPSPWDAMPMARVSATGDMGTSYGQGQGQQRAPRRSASAPLPAADDGYFGGAQQAPPRRRRSSVVWQDEAQAAGPYSGGQY